MYIKVRQTIAFNSIKEIPVIISKTASIKELRAEISRLFNVPKSQQKLIYKGKFLINEHKISDYDIQLNDVVQLLVATPIINESSNESQTEIDNKTIKHDSSIGNNCLKLSEPAESKYYHIGDAIDVMKMEFGAWFEAKVIKITKIVESATTNEENNLVFTVKLETNQFYQIPQTFDVTFEEIRPRAHRRLPLSEIKKGVIVMVNYNIEEHKEIGYWYDMEVTKVARGTLEGNIFIGKDKYILEKCTIKFTQEIFKIEEPVLNSLKVPISSVALRKIQLQCTKCHDKLNTKCKECGCRICGGKDNPDKMILCDECDYAHHIGCLNPRLEEIPNDPEWFCPECKIDENEIVKAGDKLKFSNKKAKMRSNKNGASRDWGRGMACVGRTKICSIVPKEHFGPIPGIEVGTTWKFRLQVSEAGVHRPHVAGIHGRESDGAYSIVLSGGYEDDIDNGEEFIYTGSGGRDLSGNKRISSQSCNQTLRRMNKALALNCNAPLNPEGAHAVDWKKGKPVRVVRNYKLGKYSKYAPEEGNRYDGIYKVVKYYPEKGLSGFLVWKYLLRRDDLVPPPWEENGQELEIIYPPGYLEAMLNKNVSPSNSTKNGVKRPSSSKSMSNTSKKLKLSSFILSSDVTKAIKKDAKNKKLWKECNEVIPQGKKTFLEKVEETFQCICCYEVVYLPVTTVCGHNFCKGCLKRSYVSDIYNCPNCRTDLRKNENVTPNNALDAALKLLFPGYEKGR